VRGRNVALGTTGEWQRVCTRYCCGQVCLLLVLCLLGRRPRGGEEDLYEIIIHAAGGPVIMNSRAHACRNWKDDTKLNSLARRERRKCRAVMQINHNHRPAFPLVANGAFGVEALCGGGVARHSTQHTATAAAHTQSARSQPRTSSTSKDSEEDGSRWRRHGEGRKDLPLLLECCP
jgi:hypothetical protein